MPDLKRFYRQLGYRLGEIQSQRGWKEADIKRRNYNFGSWERHRRGDAGMSAGTALKICALCRLPLHEIFKGADKGIYRKLPRVVRKRPYQMRDDLNTPAEDDFRSRLAACRSLPEHVKGEMSLDEFKIRFGWRIRRLRLERGWSLGDIVDREGDANTWQHWERGRRCSLVSSWATICEILKIDLDILLRGIETEGDELIAA